MTAYQCQLGQFLLALLIVAFLLLGFAAGIHFQKHRDA